MHVAIAVALAVRLASQLAAELAGEFASQGCCCRCGGGGLWPRLLCGRADTAFFAKAADSAAFGSVDMCRRGGRRRSQSAWLCSGSLALAGILARALAMVLAPLGAPGTLVAAEAAGVCSNRRRCGSGRCHRLAQTFWRVLAIMPLCLRRTSELWQLFAPSLLPPPQRTQSPSSTRPSWR